MTVELFSPHNSPDLRGDLGNDVAGQVPDDPVALILDPRHLALDQPQQTDPALRRHFMPVDQPLEASGQPVKLGPFKCVHRSGLRFRELSGARQPKVVSKFRREILKDAENCS